MEILTFEYKKAPVSGGFFCAYNLAFHSFINSVMVSRTEVILFARQALLPAKAYPFSKFPLKALYKAVTIQYGLRDISHVLIQLKGQAFGCLIPAFTFSKGNCNGWLVRACRRDF